MTHYRVLNFFALAIALKLIAGCASSSAPHLPTTGPLQKAFPQLRTESSPSQNTAVVRRAQNSTNKAADTSWTSKIKEQRKPAASLGFGGASENVDDKLVRIFYGTTRKIETDQKNDRHFSNQRGSELVQGYCFVSIPAEHAMGQIERPVWLYSPKLGRHFVMTELFDTTRPYFSELVGAELLAASKKRMLVYVHGIANSFEDSAFRAAQLKHDLDFDGPVAFFSWPSGASAMDYLVAGNNSEWSVVQLANFLDDLMTDVGDGQIILVAHSMGTKLTSAALSKLGPQKKRISELILASPDIDSDVFKRDIAPVLAERTNRVTIYASADDGALGWSEYFSGGKRLGANAASVSSGNIEVVDTSKVVSEGFLSHSDYAESRPALTDLSYLVNLQLPASKRSGLVRVTQSGVSYWQIKP